MTTPKGGKYSYPYEILKPKNEKQEIIDYKNLQKEVSELKVHTLKLAKQGEKLMKYLVKKEKSTANLPPLQAKRSKTYKG